MIPEKAIKHCDCVIIGGVGNVWANRLEDFRAGNQKRFYRSKKLYDLKNLPTEKFDLLNRKYFSYL